VLEVFDFLPSRPCLAIVPMRICKIVKNFYNFTFAKKRKGTRIRGESGGGEAGRVRSKSDRPASHLEVAGNRQGNFGGNPSGEGGGG